ncbi:MAG: MBL fold metallo-hydrolase, partial [Planctomycetota bacterium]|nr:MBL fold metallo-hydrolase [Planctomycetota bacterium]
MHIQFWGAAQTVTGSMHLVHVNEQQLLLDCGLYQGKRKEAFERNRDFPIDAKSIDAVILSHAHIDHSGNLPTLVKNGFHKSIYSTHATRDLATHLLMDSAHIQEQDVKYVNKKRKRQGKNLFQPLYEKTDAVKAINRFRPVDYHAEFSPLEQVRCHFHDAGHMLGSAVTEINLDEKGRQIRLVFSGDIGRPEMPILRDPETVQGADYLIMEATYGNRLHDKSGDAKEKLKQIVNETFAKQGKLIIPAFSVGRTQQIVYWLDQLAEAGELEPIKVFVDSPLAVNATQVFRSHVECYDEEMMNHLMNEDDNDPLGFRNLHYIRKVAMSKALNQYQGPAVIISASGMCEAGRILHHLKNSVSDPNNTILFSGFQAFHTLGRRILDGHQDIRIFGEELKVNAAVHRLESSSGHADQEELMEWTREIANQGNLKGIALVHCENDSATALKDK